MPPRTRRAVGSTHSPRYRAFLARLREARVTAGMTQVQAANALRRPQSFIAKAEAGECRVDVVELEQFAKLYGRSLLYFLPKASKR